MRKQSLHFTSLFMKSHLRCRTLIVLLVLLHKTSAKCRAVEECLQGDTCTVLPFPRSSMPRPVPNRGYSLHELRPGVYTLFDGIYRSLILYKERRLAVVDFPESSFRNGRYSPTLASLKVLKGEAPLRLDMVYSHRHMDHIGAAGRYYSDMKTLFPELAVNVWGTKETELFVEKLNTSIPGVNILVYEQGRTVNLDGNLEMKLTPVGGHTREDLSCYVLPSRDGPGLMHFVDFVTPGVAPFFSFALTYDLEQYISVQEGLLDLDWKFLSAGHGRMGRKKDMEINVEYSKDSIRFIREAMAEVTSQQLNDAGLGRVSDPQAVEFANVGFSFKVVFDTHSKLCARKLIKKYGCKLGQVATFGESHCLTAWFHDLLDE